MHHGYLSPVGCEQHKAEGGWYPTPPCHTCSGELARDFSLSVSTGDWFQDRLEIPKSTDAHVPYIKQLRAMHTYHTIYSGFPTMIKTCTVFDLWLVESTDLQPMDTDGQLCIYWKIPVYMWTCTEQTCVVQGSTVYRVYQCAVTRTFCSDGNVLFLTI